MKFESSHKTIIAHQTIDQINDSVTILKHFIELNSKLLPALFDLKEIEYPNENDCLKISKIQKVFNSYGFTPESSEVLINSSILQMIYTAYLAISSPIKCHNTIESLLDFKQEYNRLKKEWKIIQQN